MVTTVQQPVEGSHAHAGRSWQRKGESAKPLFFQPKLTVGPVDDVYEREADHVADAVMRMGDGEVLQRRISPVSVQRKCAACEEEENLQRKEKGGLPAGGEAPGMVHDALREGGNPLDEKTASMMGSRFGYDFGDVRIHTGVVAARSAQSIHAQAYTHGSDIVFNEGQYTPGTATGGKLLAHELTHILQQRSAKSPSLQAVQREVSPRDPDRIHGPLLDQYSAETGIDRAHASQHDPEYEQWLAYAAATGCQFVPPRVTREDALARFLNGSSAAGLTTLTINRGVVATDADVVAAITPPVVNTVSGGQTQCRFDPAFKLLTSANVIVATNPPGPTGWTNTAPPAAIGNPPQCGGQATVPVTLQGNPSNQDFADRITNSEMEHVREIETLHQRHFCPYYNFIMGLSAAGPNQAACRTNLTAAVGSRVTQATFGFLLGYGAQNQRYDDPSSTHHDSMVVNVSPGCTAATLTTRQTNANVPGAGPGNVVAIPPSVQAFAPAGLAATGSNLMNGAAVLKTFSSNANAQQALGVIRHYGATSMNTIGPFEFLLVNGAPPAGVLAGANEFDLDPALYQVSLSPMMGNTWRISQVVGANVTTIVDFGASRDQAYSAVDIMRRNAFTKLCWIGGTRQAPEMMYFRV